MIPCNKRVKILDEFKCIMRGCEHHGQTVGSEICTACPLRDAANMGMADRAKALGKSLVATVMDGHLLEEPEAVEARREVCRDCPSGKRRKNRCLSCGCNIYLKTTLKHFDCPHGHWDQ